MDSQDGDGRDAVGVYLQEIGKFPLLTREKEIELAKKAKKGDKQAENQLIEANLRLVVYIAKEYIGYIDGKLTFLDLIQEGNLGLFETVKRFDPERGIKFSSYAGYWIRSKISRALRNQRTIKISFHLLEQLNLLKRINNLYFKEKGGWPTPEEIAQKMGISLKKVNKLFQLPRAISLEIPIGQGDHWKSGRISDLIPNKRATNPEEVVQQKELKEQTNKVLSLLKPREEKILRKRFGIGEQEQTLEEISDEFQFSREWVRQIEKKAIGKLQRPKKRKPLEDFAE